MKKLLILGLLFLTACSTPLFQPVANPLNANRLAEIEASYGIALSAAVAYRRLPLCKKSSPFNAIKNICAKRSIIVQLQNADAKAQITLTSARRFVAENPTLDAFNLISAAQNAVMTLQAIEAANGVN